MKYEQCQKGVKAAERLIERGLDSNHFLQYRVVTFLGKVLVLFIVFSFSDHYLLRTNISDNSNFDLIFQRALPDVLEGVALKISLGTSPQIPSFSSLRFFARYLCLEFPNNYASFFQHTLMAGFHYG